MSRAPLALAAAIEHCSIGIASSRHFAQPGGFAPWKMRPVPSAAGAASASFIASPDTHCISGGPYQLPGHGLDRDGGPGRTSRRRAEPWRQRRRSRPWRRPPALSCRFARERHHDVEPSSPSNCLHQPFYGQTAAIVTVEVAFLSAPYRHRASGRFAACPNQRVPEHPSSRRP